MKPTGGVRPSTRAFWREARGIPGFSLLELVHGYIYARWPYLYIGIGTGQHWLARVTGPLTRLAGAAVRSLRPPRAGRPTLADGYHGKVVPLEAARQLVTVRRDIELRDLEQIVPYAKARDIVLRNPEQIAALECPCRAARDDPCLPLDVCLIVGEPFASFVTEHHPNRSRLITQAEAEAILAAEHARGHVHHAFFKDAMLGRFYAICNCCACCCGAISAMRNGTPMLASSGYRVVVEPDRCTGCGLCQAGCQFGALVLGEAGTVHVTDRCMGCGVCVSRCPHQALALSRDRSQGEPLEIRRLIQEAAGCGSS